ncbi:Aste57867_13257 [Aphanomyces stellatus]|uniref:Aste57867_13257 protein n=1 Tax=Aphanomyces stellatus TaxID=120398 RepID=A0A485KY43_9STRA|nr:hypothetical protein As57867_013208 [Aphanomyces stellatus]VFT90097.1 Aste57867_13257 [Aphanomyces stellatus]
MNGVVVVDMRGGGLLYAKALSKDFHERHPPKTHMNLAALMFAVVNYAGSWPLVVVAMLTSCVSAVSVTDCASSRLRLYETNDERMVFELVPTKQWLLVVFAAPLVSLGRVRWIAEHMAHAFADLADMSTEPRASQAKKFATTACHVFRTTIDAMAREMTAEFLVSHVLLHCTAKRKVATDSPVVVAASMARWKRQLAHIFVHHPWWRRRHRHPMNQIAALQDDPATPPRLVMHVQANDAKKAIAWNTTATDDIFACIERLTPSRGKPLASSSHTTIHCSRSSDASTHYFVLVHSDRLHLVFYAANPIRSISSHVTDSMRPMQAIADAILVLE